MFKIKAVLEGVNRLFAKFSKRKEESVQKDNGSYTVGYAAPYALFVHENMEAHHTKGQAKFLEAPARAMREELGDSIKGDVKNGIGLRLATQNAAVKLLHASQELVPEDTGALKASGFVR